MSDDYRKWDVEWATQIGPGATFYSGTETVWAEDKEQAAERAQREVHRRAFRDFNQGHIRIKTVKEA
jgi:hypothetical protein